MAFLGLIFSRQTIHSACPETSCWVRRSLKLSSVLDFLDDDDDVEAVEDCFLLGLLLLVFWTVSEADRASWPRGFPYKENKLSIEIIEIRIVFRIDYVPCMNFVYGYFDLYQAYYYFYYHFHEFYQDSLAGSLHYCSGLEVHFQLNDLLFWHL